MGQINQNTARILIGCIQTYRVLLSPIMGPHCRFYPTCSVYAIEAIRYHGILRGSWLAIKRLGCCHPWHAGGVDFVPTTIGAAQNSCGTGKHKHQQKEMEI